jgi:hypothetical protein
MKNKTKYSLKEAVDRFRPGKQVKVVKNIGDHNYGPNGTVFTISNNVKVSTTALNRACDSAFGGGNFLLFEEFELIESYEDLVKELKELSLRKVEIQKKLNWMDENNKDFIEND